MSEINRESKGCIPETFSVNCPGFKYISYTIASITINLNDCNRGGADARK